MKSPLKTPAVIHNIVKMDDFNKSGIHVTPTIGDGDTICNNTNFQVDTGSSGIVAGLENFGLIGYEELDKKYPCFGVYTMHYYPSTISHTGKWYYMPVCFAGTDSSNPPIAVTIQSHAMVLVCPGSVGMMGVSAKGENPAFNVFLQASMSAPYCETVPLDPGYTLFRERVLLGTTTSNMKGYVGSSLTMVSPPPLPTQTNDVKFTPPFPSNPASKDGQPQDTACWTVPPVTLQITAPGQDTPAPSYPLCFELDTGINQVLIAMPYDFADTTGNPLPPTALGQYNAGAGQWFFAPKTTLTVTFPPGATSDDGISYSWTVGVAPTAGEAGPTGPTLYMGPPTYTSTIQQPQGPTKLPPLSGNLSPELLPPGAKPAPEHHAATAQPLQNNNFPRVNVGRCPLNAWSYLFDAQNGFIGFKAIG
ncbi:hypothetical protein [Nitrospirillum pindoramense]|uniref:Peptidase A1 domain-containing protein n=1 Tax=Nitrospirillum amazonense TaxID=28077 RepID=A0A560HA40_9PROT|nr:hypothetical protein [Nitrospirillum amazonense]TWB43206.1 hypothetical protein FBZ90_10519 [Nitrospirillum amazonense]